MMIQHSNVLYCVGAEEYQSILELCDVKPEMPSHLDSQWLQNNHRTYRHGEILWLRVHLLNPQELAAQGLSDPRIYEGLCELRNVKTTDPVRTFCRNLYLVVYVLQGFVAGWSWLCRVSFGAALVKKSLEGWRLLHGRPCAGRFPKADWGCCIFNKPT